MAMSRKMVAAALAAYALAASPAYAADEEVQVYMDELNAPGELGLDMHVNDVLSGQNPADYTGQEPSVHRWRITPEFSLGLSRQFELGLYLPLATIAADGTPRAEGAKARLKWLAPHGEQGFYWGANLEIGRVDHALDQNPWNGEFKLIGGWRRGRWVAAVNGNFDFVISGPAGGPATLQLATKLGYHITPATALGIESYNGMGRREAGDRRAHRSFAGPLVDQPELLLAAGGPAQQAEPRWRHPQRAGNQAQHRLVGLAVLGLGAHLGGKPALAQLQRLHPRARRHPHRQPPLAIQQRPHGLGGGKLGAGLSQDGPRHPPAPARHRRRAARGGA